MAYTGLWRTRGQLAYARRGPYRQSTAHGAHTGGEGVQPNAAERITAPVRQGQVAAGLVEGVDPYASDGAPGWRGDRTPVTHQRGYVGTGGAPGWRAHREAYLAHAEDLGGPAEVTTDTTAMLQVDRKQRGWNTPRFTPLGNGSQAALGRGLNGLGMNNDPSAQHYAINNVGSGRVDRKFPGKRIWTRYLTPLRMRVAASAVASKPAEISPATSWASTLTPGRSGKIGLPVLRRAPRDWTEAVTIDDSSAAAEAFEPVWGL